DWLSESRFFSARWRWKWTPKWSPQRGCMPNTRRWVRRCLGRQVGPATVWLALLAAASAQDRLPVAVPSISANLPLRPIHDQDVISISVYGAPEFTRTVRVSNDGWIRLPLVARAIAARGLMPEDLELAIAAALEAENLLVMPAVSVNIAEYRTLTVSVVGAV